MSHVPDRAIEPQHATIFSNATSSFIARGLPGSVVWELAQTPQGPALLKGVTPSATLKLKILPEQKLAGIYFLRAASLAAPALMASTTLRVVPTGLQGLDAEALLDGLFPTA